MADVKWIKLSTELFDNRKIKQIEKMPDGDALVVIWLKLLILAGQVNESGFLYFTHDIPYTDQLLATEFNRPLATIQLALKTFVSFGMAEIVDDVLKVSNWERYQNVDGMEKIREQTRKRVADYRSRQKQLACNVTGNVTVTQGNATDIDIEQEKEKEKTSKKEKPVKHVYGSFKNVMLTDEQYEKLSAKTAQVDKRIEDLSGYMQSTGKRYKDHYATLLNWLRMDEDRAQEKQTARQAQTDNRGAGYYAGAADLILQAQRKG